MADNRFKVMAVGTFKESAVDCPVQLKKYQIIYDVVADKTYLRVVFESFSNKKIIGVFLNIDCADIFEQKFAEVEKAAVNVECDKKYSEFGKECPIIIPKGTKTVKAYISRVVFSDMTVWENQDLTFVAPVSDLEPYTAVKEKIQLKIELAKRNYNAKYLPVRYEKSWRCTCGHLNGNLNDVCSACGSRASILFNIFDDKNLEIRRKEDTYNEARKFDTSKDYLQASKLYRTILDYKDSKFLFAKALENSKEAIYTSALDTLKTAQKEEDFDSAIKSLSPISEYKDAKTQIEKAKEQKNEFIYNQALQRVKKDDVGKNDFDKSISDMQRIPSYKDSSEKIKEIDAQKQAFLDKKEHARKMKKVRNISIVACVIAAIVIAILIPYFVEPNLYTKETTYEEITIGDQSGYCLERYNENEDKVVIPSEYLGKPVLKIGERAFQGKSIKEITIPESVTSIGDYAFYYCSSLTSVTIPDSVTSIGSSAFYYCSSLTSVTIPDSVTSIGSSAFTYCSSLTSVTIPDSVTSIGDFTFRDCNSLTSVAIGNSVTSIGSNAFKDCYKLVEVYNKSTLSITAGSSNNGYVAHYAKNVYTTEGGSKLSTDENGYVIYTDGDEKILVAYTGTETELILPSYITKINRNAFHNCSGLTSITIPDSVTSIGYSAFLGCAKLQDIYITDIAAWCNISGLDNLMRDGSSNKKLYINNELVTSITIPNGVKTIPSSAFEGCSRLTSVTIGGSVTSIGDYAFCNCSGLTSVTIGGSMTSIGYSAFLGCKGLTSVAIGNSVTSIGDYAFCNCSGLTSVTIGGSVTSIGDRAFCNCSGLTCIIVDEGNSKYHSAGNCLIKTATKTLILGCKTSVIPTDGSVTSIGDSAFEGCKGLTSITIPDSVTSIGDSAFEGCKGLTSITIPDSVTSIGDSAFEGCSGLTSITIPDSVTSIGWSAFEDCSGLTSITIPDNVTSIGYQAFAYCSGLTSVTIGNGVTSIREDAFWGCTGLTSINFNGTKAQWNAISKGSDWKYNVPAMQVICKDGTVSI